MVLVEYPVKVIKGASYGSTAGKQIEDQNDNRQHKENVDPAAKGIATDEADRPQYDEQNGDGPKHEILLENVRQPIAASVEPGNAASGRLIVSCRIEGAGLSCEFFLEDL